MITRSQALERIRQGISPWADLDMTNVRFLFDEGLEHERDEVVGRRERVRALSNERDWETLLDPSRGWLNATLLRDEDQNPYIALRTGGRGTAHADPGDTEIAITVSIETKPLRFE